MIRGYKKGLVIGLALFLLMSLPLGFVARLRGGVAAVVAPLWKKKNASDPKQEQLKQIEADNFVLLEEIKRVYALLQQQSSIEACQKELSTYKETKRLEESAFLQGALRAAAPCKVIYREPKCYGSSLWIDVGKSTNDRLNRKVIAKNSPVVLGRQAVGVVDYVGKKQSRVRLITDSGLHPSVRAVRGAQPNRALLSSIYEVLKGIELREELPLTKEEKGWLIARLKKVASAMGQETGSVYLAKGILEGAASTSARTRGPTLRGVGFNYDFADKEGEARGFTEALIKAGDHLVTTGMDGVFPAGLNVGVVTHVVTPDEGAYTYQIEARPFSDDLQNLTVLFVMPPIGYDANEEFYK